MWSYVIWRGDLGWCNVLGRFLAVMFLPEEMYYFVEYSRHFNYTNPTLWQSQSPSLFISMSCPPCHPRKLKTACKLMIFDVDDDMHIFLEAAGNTGKWLCSKMSYFTCYLCYSYRFSLAHQMYRDMTNVCIRGSAFSQNDHLSWSNQGIKCIQVSMGSIYLFYLIRMIKICLFQLIVIKILII